MLRSMAWGCVMVALLALGLGCDGGTASLSTPKGAATAFMQALERGDAAAAKAAAVSDPATDKAIEGMAAVISGFNRVRVAAEARFGKEQATLFQQTEQATMTSDIEQAQETISGDTATLTTKDNADTIKLKRVNGQWKVDLTDELRNQEAMAGDEARQMGKALNDLADEIKAGKYKTAQEAQMAMVMKMMSMGGER